MTNQGKIREAERIIREACPELMELSFGCKVEVYFPEYGNQSESSGEYSPSKTMTATVINQDEPLAFLDSEHAYDVYVKDFKGGVEFIDDEDGIVCTVLGHPIQLHHVLMAISGKLPCGSWITTTEYLCFHEADTDNELCVWNLLHGWDGQSEETKLFVAGALGVK